MILSKEEYKAKITINCSDIERARAILESLTPDNRQTPKEIMITSTQTDSVICLRILCYKGIGSLITTLDDILACIQAAEQTISNI